MSQKVADDILITAVEGGIQYWAVVHAYDCEENRPATAVISDMDDPERKRYTLNAAVIRKGFNVLARKARAGEPGGVHARVLDPLKLYVRTNGEAGDFDAEGADAAVQAGIFGEVIFG